MRITGGNLCGRKVEMPRGALEIRPAMDRMRESVFGVLVSMLGSLEGYSFLDLFSGSGIIGLEAASRGADPVTCVEKDKDKFPWLLRNVSIAQGIVQCKAQSVELFLARSKIPHDIVFCDPPFPYRYRAQLIATLAESISVAREALVLIHYPSEDPPPDRSGRLITVDERAYGRSIVRFYRATGIRVQDSGNQE